MIALLLDLANIIGGFLLAVPLLQHPRIGNALARIDAVAAPHAWIVGLVALITGGYYLIYHLANGPQVFHFELIGIAVGIALVWDRLTGQSGKGRQPRLHGGVEGAALLISVFGAIAIIVGVQGLFTPN